MENLRHQKHHVFQTLGGKTYLRPMKSQHLAGFDLEVEDAECVVLRQVFHTQRLENLDFIGVLGIQRENNSPLSPKGPPTALRPSAPSTLLERAEYVKDR
jgi:hypothetical protein